MLEVFQNIPINDNHVIVYFLRLMIFVFQTENSVIDQTCSLFSVQTTVVAVTRIITSIACLLIAVQVSPHIHQYTSHHMIIALII